MKSNDSDNATSTSVSSEKQGDSYEDEWKTLQIPVEDIQRDVLVKIPKLDLFAKTKY